ncbi:hypothetical protein PROFUN_13524 [Planoprotostelium fungivorum]|uniref:Arb2 domain-containing protein n=1 Tax=Planoprotostelium fungivorum TaxID=1890364 RepID=A0A2P6N3I7_9EUKA|nr:hypothetical protein PROFUN_13524 [Planoprotostelium fungivorum]
MSQSESNTNDKACINCSSQEQVYGDCSHPLCRSCWSEHWNESFKRNAASVISDHLHGQLTCAKCAKVTQVGREKLEESETSELREKLKGIISTIPRHTPRGPAPPTQLSDFNYAFNEHGELKNRTTGDGFQWITQRHYDVLADAVNVHVQRELQTKYKLTETWLPPSDSEAPDGHQDTYGRLNIFTSKDFTTNEGGCLVIIQGLGPVRPGVWALAPIINNRMDEATMYSYINAAVERKWSVIILNPNSNGYVSVSEEERKRQDEEREEKEEESVEYYLSSLKTHPNRYRGTEKNIPGHEDRQTHTLTVWKEMISTKCPAKNLYFTAFSAGGRCMMELLNCGDKRLFERARGLAQMDSCTPVGHSKEAKEFIKKRAVHWVASDEAVNTVVQKADGKRYLCEERSGGDSRHSWVPAACASHVFQFFDSIKEK